MRLASAMRRYVFSCELTTVQRIEVGFVWRNAQRAMYPKKVVPFNIKNKKCRGETLDFANW